MQRTLTQLSEHFHIEKNDRSREHAYRWKPNFIRINNEEADVPKMYFLSLENFR